MKQLHFSVLVTSDVICPWCRLGISRLETAVRDTIREHKNVVELSFDLVWQPWLLSPKLETKVDEKGIAKRLSYEKKFKSSRKYEAYARKIIALGEQETPPIAFNFGENSVTAGTLDAHRLMVLAERFEAERGNRNREFLDDLPSKLMMAMLNAYHVGGESPRSRSVLMRCVEAAAKEAALPSTESLAFVKEAEEWLGISKHKGEQEDVEGRASQNGRQEVLDRIQEAARAGVTGVPHFFMRAELRSGGPVTVKRASIPGAQDAEYFRISMRRLVAKILDESGAAGGARGKL